MFGMLNEFSRSVFQRQGLLEEIFGKILNSENAGGFINKMAAQGVQ